MSLRSLLLPPFILMTLAYAGDGVPPRGCAADYPASMSPGNLTIGVACVSATTAKQIFNADLNAHGYVVFEVSVFPNSGEQADVSTAGFRLSQGADPSVARAVPPHDVAAAIYPQRSSKPETPGNVSVRSSDTIGYSTSTGSRPGANRSGVYTDTNVGVGVGRDPNAPPPPPPNRSMVALEQRLEDQSLPEGITAHPLAGYVYFPKPGKDRRGVYNLTYAGKEGQGSLKLTPPAH